MPRFDTIREEDLPASLERQISQQREWCAIKNEGEVIQFQGKDFVVLPGVFPPGDDTIQLISNLGPVVGKTILDYGSGTGALAVSVASQKARCVHAIDINPTAVANTARNAQLWGLTDVIKSYVSDGFEATPPNLKFDIIAANLPGRNLTATNYVEVAHWDTDFKAHRTLFSEAKNRLSECGEVVIAKANYPEINDVVEISRSNGFEISIVDVEAPLRDNPRRSYILSFKLP